MRQGTSSISPCQMSQDDISLIGLLQERDGTSEEEDLETDSVNGFDAFGNVLDGHKCNKFCSHCRTCFNLDYDLISRNGSHPGEREIRSTLPSLAISVKNGCQTCSLLESGIRVAFSADKTGKALRDIQGAHLAICVERKHSVNLVLWDEDCPVLQLEYYTIAGTTPTRSF
jgi:hypothetical protein